MVGNWHSGWMADVCASRVLLEAHQLMLLDSSLDWAGLEIMIVMTWLL